MSIPLILNDLLLPLAEGAPAAGQAPGWADAIRSLGYMPVLMAALLMFVFMTTRAKKREAKERNDLLAAIKRGDRVETVGGILGKVVDAEETKVLLKVDESSNTKIWFSRKAIHRVLAEEKEAVKAK